MTKNLGYDEVAAYRAVFWDMLLLESSVLAGTGTQQSMRREKKQAPLLAGSRNAPLLGDGAEDEEPKKKAIEVASSFTGNQ